MESGSGIEIRLFGAPEIRVDGRYVEFDTRKAVALLAYLATTGQAHQRDAIAVMLWPDYDQSRARAALRRTLSTLRKGLEDRALLVDRSTIGLDAEAVTTDVVAFRDLLAQVESHEHGTGPCAWCADLLRQAVQLVRGDFLAGFTLRDAGGFDEWHFFESESLRRALARALNDLAAWSLETDEPGEAVEHARRWVALDPLHEPAHQLLMRGFAAAGDRAAVARQYREVVRVLDEELGVPPLTETTALYEALTVPTGSRSTTLQPVTEAPVASRQVAFPIVGREADLAVGAQALAAARKEGSLLVIEGEAGVGKSRLAEEITGTLDTLTLRASAHATGSGLAYAVVGELMRAALGAVPPSALEPRVRAEVARLLPAVGREGDPQVPSLDQPGALTGFFEAIVQLLSRATDPGISAVVVDDLQWADEASLDALSYLARRVPDQRYLLMFVWRTEEVDPGHRLRALLSELRRSGQAREIRLDRLDESDTKELVVAAGVSDDAVSDRLYEETEGLPFFLVEYLRAIEAGSPLMPTGARDLLTTRLARTSETARQVLTAAAILGGPSDTDLIRETSGRTDEETVSAIEELVGVGLLRVRETDYGFGHEKMRELVYEDAGPARRRSLHRRAAEALRRRIRRTGEEGLNAALAYHLSASGAEEEAALASWAAGDHARGLFANEDALRHYERALAMHPPDVGHLHEAIGDVSVLLGEYERAVLSFERAAASSPKDRIAPLEARIAEVHQRSGRWDLADMHHSAALEATHGSDVALRARITADRSLTARRRGDLQAARGLALESLELASSSGDAASMARVRNILGIICLAERDPSGAIEHLEQSLVSSEELADPSARIAALNNLASAHRAAGEFDQALAYAGAALDLCASQGDRHREAALHSNMADLLHASGRPDEALVHLKEAAGLFTSIGGSISEPEIWKLVEW